MKKILNWWNTRRIRAIEDYLAKSTDLVDLERRQQELVSQRDLLKFCDKPYLDTYIKQGE